ncbi:MAG: glycosyltransferase family 4 protein [Candidatus Nanopelagicales bacterium]
MRVLHVSWEYPPMVYGGLGRHVHSLAEAQAARGDEVTVLTQSAGVETVRETPGGVDVVRVPHDPPALEFTEANLLAWVLGMQTALIRVGSSLGRVDVIHAHDWVSAHAAIALRPILSADALLSTIHATEAGRHQGWLPGPLSEAIHDIEHWLVHTSDRIIVCSHHMRREIEQLFDVKPPQDHIDVIANGIDLRRWRTTAAQAAQAREAHTAHGPLVVFVGRLEWEKGAHTLIEALPELRRRAPGLRAAVAGRGGHAQALEALANERRVTDSVDFVGWLPDTHLHALMAAADALVLPSLYEPFGLVSLEGAALGTPLVVARTGGLAEFVIDDVTGRTFTPGDPAALADAVMSTLDNPDDAQRMARAARERLRSDHDWAGLAARTDDAYLRARAPESKEITRRRAQPIPAPRGAADRSINLLGR